MVIQRAIPEAAHAIMLRFRGGKIHLHQRQKGLLQHILRLAMTQAQRTAIKDQLRRFCVVERFTPMSLEAFVHDFNS